MRMKAAVLALLVGTATPAAAQEYCVACTEPGALYRCVIDGARPGAAPSLQALCISALAKGGSHATCAIRRDLGVIDCNGAIKRVSATVDGGLIVPEAPPATTAQDTQQGPPKTVAEMLKRAKAESDREWSETGDQLKISSDKAGAFFKKSWQCLTSLFGTCGGN
jgi:hypothetical protein